MDVNGELLSSKQTVFAKYRQFIGIDINNEALDALNILYGDSSKTQEDVQSNSDTAAKPPTELEGLGQLEWDLQARRIVQLGSFCDELDTFSNSVTGLKQTLSGVHSISDQMNDRLKIAREVAVPCAEQTSRIHRQNALLLQHLRVNSVILDKFALSDAEAELLLNNDSSVSTPLFEAIAKGESIVSSSHVLFTESSTVLGQSIIEQTTQCLDAAYHRLYRWVKTELSDVFSKDRTYYGSLRMLHECLFHLKRSPHLYEQVQDVFAQVRSNMLQNDFITALTQEGPNGVPRPIEIHAHDPLKYVGAMLAWIHQAVATEYELLKELLQFSEQHESIRRVGTAHFDFSTDLPDDAKAVLDQLDRHFGTVLKTLTLRVTQTLESQEACVAPFHLAHLIDYYESTFGNTLGPDSLVTKTFSELYSKAYNSFMALLEAQSQSWVIKASAEGSGELILRDVLSVLTEILQSVVDDSFSAGRRAKSPTEMSRILELTTRPYLDVIGIVGPGDLVFKYNAYQQLLSTLDGFHASKALAEPLRAEQAELSSQITQEYVNSLLETYNLAGLLVNKSQDPTTISDALRGIDALGINLSTISPTLSKLSPKVQGGIHKKALDVVRHKYAEVYDEFSKNPDLIKQLYRSKFEVDTLLGEY